MLFVGSESTMPQDILDALFRYRYRVFVKGLGWRLNGADGEFERDEFDTPKTIYLVATNSSREVCGCARLLPTSQPYLLGTVFPMLLNGAPPSSARIWELSRFSTLGGAPSSGRALFLRTLRAAHQDGADEVIGVMSTHVEATLLGYRIALRRLAPPQCLAGEPLIACSVELSALDLYEAPHSVRPAPMMVRSQTRISA